MGTAKLNNDYDYPLNMLVDFLDISSDVVANHYSDILSLYSVLFEGDHPILSQGYMDILQYRYRLKMAYSDIGRKLGLSATSIQAKIKKCKDKICFRYNRLLVTDVFNCKAPIFDVSISNEQPVSCKKPISNPIKLPWSLKPIKRYYNCKYTQSGLDYLSNLLWKKARDNYFDALQLTSEMGIKDSSSLFLSFMKQDSNRMQGNMPYIVETVLKTLSSDDDYAEIRTKWGIESFITNVLLGNNSSMQNKYSVRALQRKVLLRLLSASSVYYMWYGSEYQSNLEARLGYLKAGYYNEALVGLDELGISVVTYPYDAYNRIHFYTLNSLIPAVYDISKGLSVSDYKKLQRLGFIHPKFHIVNGPIKVGYYEKDVYFTCDYPLNLYTELLKVSYSTVANYYDELYSFSVNHLKKMGDVCGDIVKLLPCKYKDNMSSKEIALHFKISDNRYNSIMTSLKKKIIDDYSSIPVEDTPWDVNRKVISAKPIRPISIIPVKSNANVLSVKAGDNFVEIEKLPSVSTPFTNMYLYSSHLAVNKELPDENACRDYIRNFLDSIKSADLNVYFLSNDFHGGYYRLCNNNTYLSNIRLDYADCKLLEQFINCPKEIQSSILSNQFGCNYANFEGLRFGLVSLLYRGGVVDKSVLDYGVFPNKSLGIPVENISFVYSDYCIIPESSKMMSDHVFISDLYLELSCHFADIMEQLGYSKEIDLLSDAGCNKIIDVLMDNICIKLKSLGFRSLNAVGFYLMNGMEGYFDNLSAWELKYLKVALQKGDFYKNS